VVVSNLCDSKIKLSWGGTNISYKFENKNPNRLRIKVTCHHNNIAKMNTTHLQSKEVSMHGVKKGVLITTFS
jgi:hypothetical protein